MANQYEAKILLNLIASTSKKLTIAKIQREQATAFTAHVHLIIQDHYFESINNCEKPDYSQYVCEFNYCDFKAAQRKLTSVSSKVKVLEYEHKFLTEKHSKLFGVDSDEDDDFIDQDFDTKFFKELDEIVGLPSSNQSKI